MKKIIIRSAILKNLKEKIADAEEKKRKLREYIRQLHEKYSKKEISYAFYIETLYKKFDGRDVREWIEHFDDYIRDCKKRVRKEIRALAVKHISIFIFSLVILISIINYILAKI